MIAPDAEGRLVSTCGCGAEPGVPCVRAPAALFAGIIGGGGELVGALAGAIDERVKRPSPGSTGSYYQAVERWHSRAIWVLSGADADYPRRLKEDAPAILFVTPLRGVTHPLALCAAGGESAQSAAEA